MRKNPQLRLKSFDENKSLWILLTYLFLFERESSTRSVRARETLVLRGKTSVALRITNTPGTGNQAMQKSNIKCSNLARIIFTQFSMKCFTFEGIRAISRLASDISGVAVPQAASFIVWKKSEVLPAKIYIVVIQSNSTTQITRSVHCKFNCITVKYNGTQHGIYITWEVH